MEDIDKLADEMRASLGDYCINECCAFCCRKGYLIVSEKELDLISGGKKQEVICCGGAKEMLNGKFLLALDNLPTGCPSLKNFKCIIHSNENRPNTCKDFPVFIVGKEIKISSRCPAKKDNKFFRFEKEAIKLGYKIVENFEGF